jgi:hypothetical protein
LTLLAIETEAVRLPLAEGVKVTLIVQVAPAATLDPQVLDWAKSPALAPVRVTLETVKAAFPVLLRVKDFAALVELNGWLAKLRLEGETLIPAAAPVPERLTVWALTLLAIETAAVRFPLAEGVKVTLMVQLAPAATLDPQLLVWAKSPAFVPVIVTLEIVRAELPELLMVTA